MTTLLLILLLFTQTTQSEAQWRQATESELSKIVPERAPVEKERIETEFRTASAIIDKKGRYVSGVVMITAGYSAEGKYSHFFENQVPLRMGDLHLPAGKHVFGYQRIENDQLRVMFYTAETGKLVGAVTAKVKKKAGPIRSFLITPPTRETEGIIQIGRFYFDYRTENSK
jgi:hypothetical protein